MTRTLIFTQKCWIYAMLHLSVEQVNTPQVALRTQGDGLDGGLMASEAVKHLTRFDVPDLN